jgi:hypothetical protein
MDYLKIMNGVIDMTEEIKQLFEDISLTDWQRRCAVIEAMLREDEEILELLR